MDVWTLSAAKKRAPKRVANVNPSLQYYLILLACKFSGKFRKNKPKKKNRQINRNKMFSPKLVF